MDEQQHLEMRRQVVAVKLFAAENAARVMHACAAPSTDGPEAALVEAFGLSDFEAQVILDMQVRSFSPAQTNRLRAELADIDARIQEFEASA